MKAGTLAAAAIAIAVAAPATAAAQPAPSEETTAKAAACLQEALATKTDSRRKNSDPWRQWSLKATW